MRGNKEEGTDREGAERRGGHSTTRRRFIRAGGAGGTALGIAGFASAAGAEESRRRSSAGGDGAGSDLTLDGDLEGLLRRNQTWTDALPEGYFSDVQDSQAPTVTSVCCSDSRVSQEGMFLGFLEAGFLFTPSNIGNQVIRLVDGERVVDGDFLYGLENADSENGVVVGHTDCGAITAAYELATGESLDEPPGIDRELRVLVDIVRDGLESDLVDADASDSEVVNQLVEYNVNRQVEFLAESDEVADERSLYGFVYDFQGAYGGTRGRTYLVNIDGETDQSTLRERVADPYGPFVRSLLR